MAFLSLLRTGTGDDLNFSGNDSNHAGIFGPISGAGSPLGLIVRENDPAPGANDGAEFSFFDSPTLNASGDVAFSASLRTGTGDAVDFSNDEGVFGPLSGAGSPLGLIARENDLAPGVDDGAEFRSFDNPSINALGDVAFRALLREESGDSLNTSIDRAIFAYIDGELELVVREGDQITVTLPGGFGTQERTVSAVDFGLSDTGTLALNLSFTNGTAGIFTAVVDSDFTAVPEPGSLALLSLISVGVIVRRRK